MTATQYEVNFGMGILKKNRHEIFAQGLAIGMTADAAYVAAGYKRNRGNAATAKANQSISQRVREIKEAAAERAAKTLDEIIAELERIAFGGMSKFVRIDDNGQPKIDLSNCTPKDLDLLSELTPTVRSAGGTATLVSVKIKVPNRLKALETLGKHLGLGDRKATNTKDSLAEAIDSIVRRGSSAPIATVLLRKK